MPPKWKIFYVDGSTLKWDEVAAGDPKNIANPQRVGVHSVIQGIENDTMRETIEQYHYIFSIRDAAWVGVGYDGLLDHIVNDFNNIRAVLHGRTNTQERFWAIKQAVKVDTEIVGGQTMASVYEDPDARAAYLNINSVLPGDPYYQHTGGPYTDPRTECWTDYARHRPYDPSVSEPGVYGEQTFYG